MSEEGGSGQAVEVERKSGEEGLEGAERGGLVGVGARGGCGGLAAGIGWPAMRRELLSRMRSWTDWGQASTYRCERISRLADKRGLTALVGDGARRNTRGRVEDRPGARSFRRGR